MIGERLTWYRLAALLGKRVEELRDSMTLEEFEDWQVVLTEQAEDRIKLEFYLAQVAAEVCRTRAKHPNQVKVDRFLLRKKTTAVAESKAVWFSALGLDPTGKPKRTKKSK